MVIGIGNNNVLNWGWEGPITFFIFLIAKLKYPKSLFGLESGFGRAKPNNMHHRLYSENVDYNIHII